MTKKQKEQFKIMASRLSPENLSCDGEISRTQVNASYRQIMKEWKQLEKEVGRKVSEAEVESWWMEDMWRRNGISEDLIQEKVKKYIEFAD